MRPAAQLQATIELLSEINETRYPADRTMAQYFKQRRFIGSKDKAVISEYLYIILRHKLSFSYLLEQAGLPISERLLAAVLMRVQNENCDLTSIFNGERYSPEPLDNEQLDELRSMDLNLQNAPQHIRLNVPEWIAGSLQNALGEYFDEEMNASNQRASTDIRVNTLKATFGQVNQVLKNAGFAFEKTSLSPWAIRFDGRVGLFGLDAFRQGWFEVQDEGSQLLALLSNVKSGDKVVDFCAGAGGKTLAMAAMMQNKGTIYACDVHSKRLDNLSKRAKRAGVHNVRTFVLNSENDKWVKKHKELADVVLIDAPCTGTGTWRRSPDSRWNLIQENVDDLVVLQQSILQSAKRLVKPGGRLLYATCSLLNEENESQVSQFLKENDDFEAIDFQLPKPLSEHQSEVALNGHLFRTFPARSGTDGFFVASMRKKLLPE